MKAVRFLQSARDDVRREKAYYEQIDPELAQKFLTAVEAAVNAAASQPLAMRALEYSIRRWPLQTFPHGVLYRDEDDGCILVLAVFHSSQSPKRWRQRAKP